MIQYLLRNPHQISKAFLRKRGEANVYAFGETPLTTLDLIAKECRILSKDCVYELGCGSARSCFWLHTFVKCEVVGVDHLPAFINKANRVKRWNRLSKIHFIKDDMLKVELQKATVIYLYGTCLEDEMIEKLIEQFKQLPARTKIITVSYPLTDYCDKTLFTVTKHFIGRFPWGKASIFLNERV